MLELDTSAQRASSAVLRYGLAVSSTAAALIVTLLLRPDALISPLFFLAIMLSAWFGGIGPGLTAAVLATLAIPYFFLPPLHSLKSAPAHLPLLAVFFLSALLVSSWSAARSRAETLLRRARDELEAKVQERTKSLRQSNEQLQAEIAERRRAEEGLQKQAGALRDQAELLELAHDAIVIRDPSSAIVFWNRGAERLYGWTRNQAMGEITHTLLRTVFPSSFHAVEAALTDRGSWEGELVHTTRDGSRLVVASRQVLQRDPSGNPIAVLEINSDITDRKRAEESVREQARLLDLTHDSIFVRDSNDVITYWNRGAEELYGWDRVDAIGKVSHQFMQTIFPAPLEEITATLLRSGRWDGELVHTKRDGTQVTVASRWSLQRDAQGRPTATLEINNDITGRKQSEESLRKAQAELARVTRAMTLGELAASIAHEVNQPIAGVVTNANACLRWLARDVPDLGEAREAVQRIVRDGNRASEVIGRIRALIGKTDTARERLDVNGAIREVVALTQGEVRRARVALRTELAGDLPPVLGDRVQLQQVLLNLITNGIDAMSAVADRPRELIIRTEPGDDDGVRIAVQDSGVGVDAESAKQIFDAFYTTKSGGMGMGLSISRSIVESHGGRLRAVPNDGPGATFQFTLAKHP
jgi:two-component system, LuxR family, sensor kinase FixL